MLEATNGTVPAQRVGAISGRRTGWEVVQRGVGRNVKVVGEFLVLPAAVIAGTACWRPARLTQQLLVAKRKMKKLSSIS